MSLYIEEWGIFSEYQVPLRKLRLQNCRLCLKLGKDMRIFSIRLEVRVISIAFDWLFLMDFQADKRSILSKLVRQNNESSLMSFYRLAYMNKSLVIKMILE
jgi:hypothetical protein